MRKSKSLVENLEINIFGKHKKKKNKQTNKLIYLVNIKKTNRQTKQKQNKQTAETNVVTNGPIRCRNFSVGLSVANQVTNKRTHSGQSASINKHDMIIRLHMGQRLP